MRMTEPEIGLAEAISAYRDGKLGEALRISRAILVGEPENAGAHYVLGIAQADAGEPAEALLALQRAVSLAPENVSFHITLGNIYLMLERDAAAARAFRQALSIAPDSAPAHVNLATTLKRQGRLEEAVMSFRTALGLLRGSTWRRPCTTEAITDPSQDETFCFASRAKLAHDIEQYEYLLARDALPSAFEREIAAHREVLAELNEAEGGRDPARRRALSLDQQARLAGSFNRLNYLPLDTNSTTEVLNPALDYCSITRQFGAAVPPVIVVDDLLSDTALVALRRFCLEATIWFDCKEHGGYLGAYMNEGFDIPLLFALARQLQKRLPNVFGGHKLVQMWAFKYGARSTGTRLHADKAAVNVNFWITPDAALENKEFGGLRLYDMAAPRELRFEDYNLQESALRAEVKRRDAPFRDIPYKCNRAAIFDSSLIHETIPLRFQDGYENRRINVTMLFGERAEV